MNKKKLEALKADWFAEIAHRVEYLPFIWVGDKQLISIDKREVVAIIKKKGFKAEPISE